MTLRLILVASALLCACAGSATPGAPPPAATPSAAPQYGVIFGLRGGQQIRFDTPLPAAPPASLALRFASVVSDERCPAQVQCVWAKPPVIVVETTFGDGPARAASLTAGTPIQFDGIRMEFLELEPVPQQPAEFAVLKPLAAYTARLRVSAARVE